MPAQRRSSAQVGKAHVGSCCDRTMSALPDAHAQALVLGVHAALRALLAGNRNRRLNSQDSRNPRTKRVGNAAPVNMSRRKTTQRRDFCACAANYQNRRANARTAPHGATEAGYAKLRSAGLFLRYGATAL